MAGLTERVMRHLAEHGLCYTRQLAAELDTSGSVIAHVCLCLRRHGLVLSWDGQHQLTEAGETWAAEGGWLPCQRLGRAATSEGRTLRQRAWNVLRMVDRTSVDDLLRTLCDGDEKGAEENLRNYCTALYRAGILGKTARTGAWFLRPEANTGPKAPSYNRLEKRVTDRNTGKSASIAGGSHV